MEVERQKRKMEMGKRLVNDVKLKRTLVKPRGTRCWPRWTWRWWKELELVNWSWNFHSLLKLNLGIENSLEKVKEMGVESQL